MMIHRSIISLGLAAMMALLAHGQQIAIAQAPTFDPLTFNWSNLSATAILAVVVVTFVWKTLPHYADKMTEGQAKTADVATTFAKTAETMQGAYTKTVETMQAGFIAVLDRISDREAQATKESNAVLREVVANCATARATIARETPG